MAAAIDLGEKLSKSERKTRKKQLRFHHTLFRHQNIKTTDIVTEHLVVANGGLDNNVRREELWEIFSKCGTVVDLTMEPRKSFSFVSYSTKNDAECAMKQVNGRKLCIASEGTAADITLYLSYVEYVPGHEVPVADMPSGLILKTGIVSEDYEHRLLESVDWNTRLTAPTPGANESLLKHRRVKHYGFEFIYGINNVDLNSPLEERIPEECRPVLDQLIHDGILSEYPDQLTINQYQPGQGIPSHIDTHSAFKDGIVSLSLGSQVVMDFRHPDGRHIPVMLPRRSALIMTGEARYVWSHGITPRKSDIVPINSCQNPSMEPINEENTKVGLNSCVLDNAAVENLEPFPVERLTLVPRGTRTSFTFRKVLKGPCQCQYARQCDSQHGNWPSNNDKMPDPHAQMPQTDKEAALLEKLHVHQVYEDIADHFSDTRHKAWPKIAEFLDQQERGAVIADIGCGNGKYLGVNRNTYTIGCDRSYNLCSICRDRGHPVYVADVLSVPLRDSCCDVAISIAVIHHLSTLNRRHRAVKEMARILRPGGRGLISVWAMEQDLDNRPSNYLQKSKLRLKQSHSGTDSTSTESENSAVGLPGPSSVGQSTEDQEELITEAGTHKEISGSEVGRAPDLLPVHVNRTQFENPDLLVPWHRKNAANRPKCKKVDLAPGDSATVDGSDRVDGDTRCKDESVYHRFYHVFERNELEELVESMPGVRVISGYYDKGNWCVIFEKKPS